MPRDVRTRQLNCFKEVVRREGCEYLLLYSHLDETVDVDARVNLARPSREAFDLSSADRFGTSVDDDGWHRLTVPLPPRQGRYLDFHDGA